MYFLSKEQQTTKEGLFLLFDFNPMIPGLVFSVKSLSPENIVTDDEKAMVGFIKNMFQKIPQVQSYLEAQNCK
ncbi:NAD glycohydrolase toxin immunity factor [Streptococcus equi]|uniref:NAD glycohydrolase toxin immunity factor n=1 Tax=Streptococcus equi TaxID=1336 RepID=UPI002F2B86DA